MLFRREFETRIKVDSETKLDSVRRLPGELLWQCQSSEVGILEVDPG